MSKSEVAFGLGIVAFGAVVLRESLQLPYFVEETPGPGFLPTWVSLAIIALGAAISAAGMRTSIPLEERPTWPGASGWLRLAVLLGALVISLLLFESVGFLVLAWAFVALVTFGLGIRSWPVLLAVPLASALVLNGVFAVMLKVPLPKGLLAFLG